MLLIFQGGSQIAKVLIVGKSLKIASFKTDHKFLCFDKLFPKSVVDEFNRMASGLSDKGFEDYVVKEFKKMGYSLVGRYESFVG